MYKEVIRTSNSITVIDPHTVTPKKVFSKVDKIPEGFEVWHIPEIAPDVVPLCEALRPSDPNCFDVNTATLKYIEIEPEKAAKLRATCGGNLKKCRRNTRRKDEYTRRHALEALPIFEELENR